MNCISTINNGGTCALDTLVENIIDKGESTLEMSHFWHKIKNNKINIIICNKLKINTSEISHLKFSPTTPFWKYFFILCDIIIISCHKCDLDIFKIINVC